MSKAKKEEPKGFWGKLYKLLTEEDEMTQARNAVRRYETIKSIIRRF